MGGYGQSRLEEIKREMQDVVAKIVASGEKYDDNSTYTYRNIERWSLKFGLFDNLIFTCICDGSMENSARNLAQGGQFKLSKATAEHKYDEINVTNIDYIMIRSGYETGYGSVFGFGPIYGLFDCRIHLYQPVGFIRTDESTYYYTNGKSSNSRTTRQQQPIMDIRICGQDLQLIVRLKSLLEEYIKLVKKK
jgi:hypothetical protein